MISFYSKLTSPEISSWLFNTCGMTAWRQMKKGTVDVLLDTRRPGIGVYDFNYVKDGKGCYMKEGLDIFLMASRGKMRING